MATIAAVLIITAMAAAYFTTEASDPSLLTDFFTPNNTNNIDANFFTFHGMRKVLFQNPPNFTLTKTSLLQFRAKIGQSVSLALLQFPGGSVNPPHTHLRAAELLLVIKGRLEVGLVDANNKLYNQRLEVGDSFLFPRGLVHFQFNSDLDNPAVAVSGFGSADAGTVSIPSAVFGSAIDDAVLALVFKTDVATVRKIRATIAS